MIEESAQLTNQQDIQILDNRPRNMKNTIIRKLTSMMGISRQNLHQVEESANLENSNLDDKRTKRHHSYCLNEDKLHKNRESARKARIRKKLYVKLLQQQVAKLQDLAAEGKFVQKQMEAFLTKFKSQINQKKDLFQLKNVLFNNMHNVSVYVNNISDDNVKPLLASYQTKLGPATADRLNSLDRQVLEIESSFVPRHVQLLFETDSKEFLSIEQSAENNPVKAAAILEKLKVEQTKLLMLFDSLRSNVDHAKCQLRTLNRIFDQLKSQCSPIQMCKLLLFIENQSNKTEIVNEFIRHLKLLQFNKVKQNEEELYDYIFKNDLRKTIFVDLPQIQELMRRVNVFLNKSTS